MPDLNLRTTDYEFAERKQQLIQTVLWYRDKIHHQDTVHTRLISRIRSTDDILALHECEVTVASWFANM